MFIWESDEPTSRVSIRTDVFVSGLASRGVLDKKTKILKKAIDGRKRNSRIMKSLANDRKIRSIQSKLFNNQVKYKSYSVTPTVVGEIRRPLE